MILHLVEEEPAEAWARGESFLRTGIEDVVFSYLRFPSGVVAHMHVSWLRSSQDAKADRRRPRQMAVFDDMEPERKVTVYDKGPCSGPPPSGRCGKSIHIPKLAGKALHARVRPFSLGS